MDIHISILKSQPLTAQYAYLFLSSSLHACAMVSDQEHKAIGIYYILHIYVLCGQTLDLKKYLPFKHFLFTNKSLYFTTLPT